MKTFSQRHAWVIISIPAIVFLFWAVIPRSDPRIKCDEVTPELVEEYWTSGNDFDRRLVINCMVGGDWDGSTLVRVESDYSGFHQYDLEDSLIYGMGKDAVRELLGHPSDEAEHFLQYSIGMKPQSPIQQILNIAWPMPKQYFEARFDETTGQIIALEIFQ